MLELRDDTNFVAGMKQRNQSPISYQQGVQLQKELGMHKYLECSAMTLEGVKVSALFHPYLCPLMFAQIIFEEAMRAVVNKSAKPVQTKDCTLL